MTKPTRAARRADARASAGKSDASSRGPRSRRGIAERKNIFVAYVHQHPWLTLGALVALNLLFALLTFMPQPHTGGDSANYLTLARSLLQQHSYTDLYDPLQPPHTKYPPVFPMMLALGMLFGLKSWVKLKLLTALVGTGAVAVTFLWIRRRGRPGLAVAVSLLLIFSALVLDQSHWLLSDVPFWCFTMIALLAFDRVRPNDRTRLALAIAAAVLAYFTRSAGLPLVLASVIWLTWRRRWTQLALFLAVLLPLAVLWWLRAHNTGGVEYTQEFWFIDPYMPALGKIGFVQLLQRIGTNAVKYATIHIPLLMTSHVGTPFAIASIIMIVLAIAGWVMRLRRAMVAEIMMPLYIGLLLVWPAVWSGERFIMPVFPLMLYYAGLAFTKIARRATRPHVFAVSAPVVALLLLLNVPPLTASITRGRMCTRSYMAGETYPCLEGGDRTYFDAAIWSEKALPGDAVVLSRKPRIFYEISHGIRGANYPMSRDPAVFFALADSVHARYVVYDRLTSLADYYLAPVLLQRPQAFCTMQSFGNDGTMMLGIIQGAATMPDQPASPESVGFVTCDRSFYR
jgi:hypothetical protein